MARSILSVILLLSVSVIGFGQQPVSNPGPNGQVWMEYPTGPIYPPNIVSLLPTIPELPMKPPTIPDFVKREHDETAWIGPNHGTIKEDRQKLFVYQTPAVQQRIGETVGRFLRPETQKLQFVMESKFLTLSDGFLEKLGTDLGDGKDYSDIRTPVEEFLQPIPGPDGKPRPETEGASVYWVAKADIPKLFGKWNKLFGAAEGDTRSDFLSGLKLATFNGQLGAILDLSAKEFTTDRTIDHFNILFTVYPSCRK